MYRNKWKWKHNAKPISSVQLLSHVQLWATPWTASYQAPPSMGFSRQEYWSGVPLPSPDTIDQVDLIDIYRTFHPKTMNFIFFSSAHGNFSRIDHILGHKSSLGKFKNIEIIPSIFSDHNAVRLDLNYKRKTIKKFQHMEAEQHAAE